MYNLFLDDIRFPLDVYKYTNDDIYANSDWIIVRSYNEFINIIMKDGIPNVISFDHDLGDIGTNNKTGYDSIKWLCDYIVDNDSTIPRIKYHTANPVGLLNMKIYFNNFIKNRFLT